MCDVGILELSWHGNLLSSMIEIAATGNNNVTVITTEETWDSAKASPLVHTQNIQDKLIVSQSELQSDVIDDIEQITKQLDFLWTVTPCGPPVVAAALLNLSIHCPSATFVHEATLYSEGDGDITADMAERAINNQSVFDKIPNQILASINNQVRMESYVNKYDLLISTFPPVKHFIDFKFPNANSDWFLPRYHKNDRDYIADKLRFTVPGRVDTKIRDYSNLLNTIESVPELNKKPSIVLLGELKRTSNSDIITTCENLNTRGFDMKFFDRRVPESQYVTELRKSNLLISPDKVHVNRDQRHVIRGQTKSTGAVGDAIQSGTALVLPNNYCVPKEYNDLIYKYRSWNHLANLITKFINSPMFRKSIKQNATGISERFDIAQQAKRFNRIRDSAIEAAQF